MRTVPPGRRSGFTLVEMLVALAVILALAAVTILVVPDVLNRSRVPSGADRLQGWLLAAKQRALRDQKPRGLRMIPARPGSGICYRAEYIEQPEDYAPGGTLALGPNPGELLLRGAPDVRGYVEPGDWIELSDTGAVHRVTALSYHQTSGETLLNVTPPVSPVPVGRFTFVRQARPLLGESPLELPRGVAVDLLQCVGLPPEASPPHDILFTPGGSAYVPRGARAGRIIYWVRDLEGGGEPTLICVYAHTGAIAAHPVNMEPDPNTGVIDPYLFTRDGRSSGL